MEVKYRYFYHDPSDCLIKLPDGSPEIEDYRHELETGELEEITREEFLQIAHRLWIRKEIDRVVDD